MLSRVTYVADGTTATFTVPFPYINKTHVKVSVNGFDQVLPPLWNNDSSITLQDPPKSGDVVLVKRETPSGDALVDFTAPAALTGNDLNIAHLQNFYINQELIDDMEQLTTEGLIPLPGGNVADGNPQTIIDNVTQNILNSDLMATLQQSLTDIDTNAQSIVDQQTRIDSQKALLDLLGSADASNTAFVLNTSTVQVDGTTTLATKLDGLAANIDSNTAAISNEATTRAQQDNALAQQINTLVASSSTFYVQDTDPSLTNTMNTGDVWYNSGDNNHPYKWDGTQWLDVRDGAITDALAQISSEQTARIDGDSSNASDITSLQATVNNNTASIQTNATAISNVDGKISGSYTLRIDVNGYVTGFGLSNDGTESLFLVSASRFAVVAPGKTSIVPFVIDSATGLVGINGGLLVKGSVTADRINVSNLSALSAAMGTVTGGLFRTATSGYRVEIGNDSSWPIWYGTGAKSAANGLFYVDSGGNVYAKNLNITGIANAANGLALTGGLVDTSTLRVDTGGGRRAPVVFEDVSTQVGGAVQNMTCYVGRVYGPDYGSGFYGLRTVANKIDVFFDIGASGDSGTETLYLEVSYNGGSYSTISTITQDFNYRGSLTWKIRYTMLSSWSYANFRVRSSQGHTMNLTMGMRVYNLGESSNSAGSYSGQTGSSGGGGVLVPKPPPGGQIP